MLIKVRIPSIALVDLVGLKETKDKIVRCEELLNSSKQRSVVYEKPENLNSTGR